MDGEAKRPVDFNHAPLLRAALLELAPDDHVLMITPHHIICDGWSNGILVRELAAFYDAFRLDVEPQLPPLAIQYADYVALAGGVAEDARVPAATRLLARASSRASSRCSISPRIFRARPRSPPARSWKAACCRHR